MIRKLLLFSVALLLSPSLFSSEPSKYERLRKFKWDSQLHSAVMLNYGSDDEFFPRLAQIYAESGFNPRATSDFKNWKQQRIDTVTAIRNGMGAAGLVQFIWPTAVRYGATSITTSQASATLYALDIYNPLWGVNAMCRYMRSIEKVLLTTRNPKARRTLMTDRRLMSMLAIASYNTGEGRVLNRVNSYGVDWYQVKPRLPEETQNYVERIMKYADEMKKENRWKLH